MKLRSLALAALLLVPAAAAAFEMYETDGGDPLRWKDDTTNVRLSTVAPKTLSLADVDAAATFGFQQWMASGCTPTVTVDGTTDATQGSTPKTIKGPADNIIVFINDAEQWRARGHTVEEIAVTIIANNPNTGEIVDADVEVNNALFELTNNENPPAGIVDFVATMTHEAGHFFGLDHSLEREATMWGKYDDADPSSKRTLSQDDLDGVCALYAIPFRSPDDCNAGGASSLGWALAVAALFGVRRRRAVSERMG